MNAEKVKQIERQLERRGYKLYTKNLIGNEDYAYMRTARNSDGELKYIISHGFYDWRDYEGALENYGYTPTIVLGDAGSEPIEVELRPAITDLNAKVQEYANSVTDNEEIRELIINAFKAGYNS